MILMIMHIEYVLRTSAFEICKKLLNVTPLALSIILYIHLIISLCSLSQSTFLKSFSILHHHYHCLDEGLINCRLVWSVFLVSLFPTIIIQKGKNDCFITLLYATPTCLIELLEVCQKVLCYKWSLQTIWKHWLSSVINSLKWYMNKHDCIIQLAADFHTFKQYHSLKIISRSRSQAYWLRSCTPYSSA